MPNKKQEAPVHPGEILQEDFMEPLGITQYKLAKAMAVYPRKVNEIVHGTRSITADTAIRLGLALNTSPDYWLSLQSMYDLQVVRWQGSVDFEHTVARLVA